MMWRVSKFTVLAICLGLHKKSDQSFFFDSKAIIRFQKANPKVQSRLCLCDPEITLGYTMWHNKSFL